MRVREESHAGDAIYRGTWVAGRSAGTGNVLGMLGGRYQVIRIGADVWLRGDSVFWEGKGAPAGYVDHWVRATSRDYRVFAEYTIIASWAKFVGGQRPLGRRPGRLIHGLPTVALRDEVGATLYVAAKGKPYPQLLDRPPLDDQRSTSEFDRWDAAVVVAPPPEEDVVGSI